MRILGLIAGIISVLFGGGCTLLFFGVSVAEGSATPSAWQTWITIGLLPLMAGLALCYLNWKRP